MEIEEISTNSRMPYPVRVSDSIKKDADLEDDVISVWGSASRSGYPEARDRHAAEVFPGFEVKKRSMKDTERDSLSSAFTSFQMESRPNMQFRNRSATEDIRSLPQLTQLELQQRKRQTIHSQTPPNEDRRLSRHESGGSGHSNRPRRSKFLPYVPGDTTRLGSPSYHNAARVSGVVHDAAGGRHSGASEHNRLAGASQRKQDQATPAIPMCKRDIDVWKPRSSPPSNQERLTFEDELQRHLEKRRIRIEHQQELQR